ncbi:hypothetical protein QDX12_26935 (plasmid) [Escherichia coli]|nr:hypothetical protein QDX12_26935 [Escherichia coli]WHG71597.1 hypothetical protein QDW94_25990 [Escherichia coli]WHG71601.1 hypothetical protein QDW94_26020 [Escherichia coli]WHG71605.1 hypothetical protein QDW94_26050 [Escherichia coli]
MSDKVTVKQTINKATSIYKIEHITVGKLGSRVGSLAAAACHGLELPL